MYENNEYLGQDTLTQTVVEVLKNGHNGYYAVEPRELRMVKCTVAPNIDLRNQELHFRFSDTRFKIDMRHVDMRGAHLFQCLEHNMKFDQCDMRGAHIEQTYFYSPIKGAKLTGASIENSTLIDTPMGVNLWDVEIGGCVFADVNGERYTAHRRHVSDADVLPDGSINSDAKTRNGYWFGTAEYPYGCFDGLTPILLLSDGRMFKRYR
jgi:hypothetical protein